MLKKIGQPNKIKSVLSKSLCALTSLSFLNIAAESSTTSKWFTAQQYEAYKHQIQVEMANQRQIQFNAKLQRIKAAKAQLPQPTQPKKPYKHSPIAREDIVLVMPNAGAKPEDIHDAIANCGGEICGRLGAGSLFVILVKAPRGKVVQVQRALAADTRDFKHVDFNTKAASDAPPGVTEPSYGKSWHLARMNVSRAWEEMFASRAPFPKAVAVFDTGVQGPEPFVAGWGANAMGNIQDDQVLDLDVVMRGFTGSALLGGGDSIQDQENDIVHIGNYIKTMTYGIIDQYGHGTLVASAIDGSNVNGKGGAGVNPLTPIFPIVIANAPPTDAHAYTDELALVKAMCVMYDELNTPVINISYASVANPANYPIANEFFKDWYYRKGGLIFVSAGNNGKNLTFKNVPYLNVVSAMAQKDGLQLKKKETSDDWGSAYGTPVDFTAPGQNIQVCDQQGNAVSADGTSLACPLVAAAASLIWTVNPNLKNTDVEKILRDSCENTDGDNTWNPKFGWGMPDAYKCVTAAEGTKR